MARIPSDGVNAFQEYEAAVLPLLAEHKGTLERHLRSPDGLAEVHLIGFPSPEDFAAYRDDPQRAVFHDLLNSSGAVMELYELHDVPCEDPT